jgi:hypothetical protein
MAQLKNYIIAINTTSYLSYFEGKNSDESPDDLYFAGLHGPSVFLVYNVSSEKEALRKQMMFELQQVQDYLAAEPDTSDADHAASQLSTNPSDEIFTHMKAFHALYSLSQYNNNAFGILQHMRDEITPVIDAMLPFFNGDRSTDEWQQYVVTYVQSNLDRIVELTFKFAKYSFYVNGIDYLLVREFPAYVPPSALGYVFSAHITDESVMAESANLRHQILSTGAQLQQRVAQQAQEIAQLRAYIAEQAAAEPESRKRRM